MHKQSFSKVWAGPFGALLKWGDLDKLWSQITHQGDWYYYPTDNKPPRHIISTEELQQHIQLIDQIIRPKYHGESEDYCGLAYVDNREDASMLKIFNPKLLGCGGGSCESSPLPHWVFSRMLPDDLQTTKTIPPSFWKRLFS